MCVCGLNPVPSSVSSPNVHTSLPLFRRSGSFLFSTPGFLIGTCMKRAESEERLGICSRPSPSPLSWPHAAGRASGRWLSFIQFVYKFDHSWVKSVRWKCPRPEAEPRQRRSSRSSAWTSWKGAEGPLYSRRRRPLRPPPRRRRDSPPAPPDPEREERHI